MNPVFPVVSVLLQEPVGILAILKVIIKDAIWILSKAYF